MSLAVLKKCLLARKHSPTAFDPREKVMMALGTSKFCLGTTTFQTIELRFDKGDLGGKVGRDADMV